MPVKCPHRHVYAFMLGLKLFEELFDWFRQLTATTCKGHRQQPTTKNDLSLSELCFAWKHTGNFPWQPFLQTACSDLPHHYFPWILLLEFFCVQGFCGLFFCFMLLICLHKSSIGTFLVGVAYFTWSWFNSCFVFRSDDLRRPLKRNANLFPLAWILPLTRLTALWNAHWVG